MTEYETAMLALREREILAIEANQKVIATSLPEMRETDEQVWSRYATARAQSTYCRTDAEVAAFANDMLKRHRALFPK